MITVMRLIYSCCLVSSSPVEKLQQDVRDMLTCSVLSYSGCGHTVKWLYDDNMDGVETVRLGCSASVTFPTHLNHKSNYHKLPECEVTDDQSGQTLLWKVNSGTFGLISWSILLR